MPLPQGPDVPGMEVGVGLPRGSSPFSKEKGREELGLGVCVEVLY